MISIIIPTYNERETIKDLIYKIYALNFKNYEIIIVDDSYDNTAEIARKILKKLKIKAKVIKREKRLGKGSAIREGLKNSKGKYLVLIDADLEYPVEKIPKIVEKLKKYDIVLTKRFKKCNFSRKLFGYFFKFLIFLFFRIKEDTQSGLKGLRREVINKVLFNLNYWFWDVEMILRAKKAKLKICSLPIVYKEREKGKSKIDLKSLILSFKEFLNLWKLI
ncbi:MAG: glycosyltransferase family 2 protein [Candidatus Aenigmatarchaeota archaeon]